MWMVEAKTFGENPQFFRYGPVSEKESIQIHKELADSGDWSLVHSWNIVEKQKQEEADARILAWAKEIEDGIGEGQTV